MGSPFGRQGPAGILLGDGGPCTAAARRWGSPYPNRSTDAADSPYLRSCALVCGCPASRRHA
ncbi:predicted protein [Streptomyces viridosporus ATCC 14672]|uniref:Predicted protein n=1 Tax=Streptomyces viridosporus (strain ATCC 14672 / DSM 40746 / JCM 4963 / KCTC 9882 / NRRL B-12104 / FH 1290) TaxID=566461 RepID=D5ZWX6_STRV1|nr:predicted protein [Streptomyces viridosporus ATCC 14672]